MYRVGSIITINDQIFSDGKKYEVDHVKKRPALVISEDDEYLYYLTLTSTTGNKYKQFKIINNRNRISYVKLENIYRKRIYGAIEAENLSDNVLLNLLIEFYNFQREGNNPIFNEIQKNILIKIKELHCSVTNKCKK